MCVVHNVGYTHTVVSVDVDVGKRKANRERERESGFHSWFSNNILHTEACIGIMIKDLLDVLYFMFGESQHVFDMFYFFLSSFCWSIQSNHVYMYNGGNRGKIWFLPKPQTTTLSITFTTWTDTLLDYVNTFHNFDQPTPLLVEYWNGLLKYYCIIRSGNG